MDLGSSESSDNERVLSCLMGTRGMQTLLMEAGGLPLWRPSSPVRERDYMREAFARRVDFSVAVQLSRASRILPSLTGGGMVSCVQGTQDVGT